jgi:hypothetical protein
MQRTALRAAADAERWPARRRNTKHMNPKIVIRSETEADVSAITEVTVAAFKTLEISNHTEQFIIEALRAAKALTVSLVAEVDGRVIGHNKRLACQKKSMRRASPTGFPTRLGSR